jgi:hypothetical protein
MAPERVARRSFNSILANIFGTDWPNSFSALPFGVVWGISTFFEVENGEISYLHGQTHRESIRATLAAARKDLLTRVLLQIANSVFTRMHGRAGKGSSLRCWDGRTKKRWLEPRLWSRDQA